MFPVEFHQILHLHMFNPHNSIKAETVKEGKETRIALIITRKAHLHPFPWWIFYVNSGKKVFLLVQLALPSRLLGNVVGFQDYSARWTFTRSNQTELNPAILNVLALKLS